MDGLRSRLPAPVRHTLGRGRRRAIAALGGQVPGPTPPPAATDGIPAGLAVGLLFPGFVDQIPDTVVKEVAPEGVVRDLGQIRRLLGATERQFAPSPVTV